MTGSVPKHDISVVMPVFISEPSTKALQNLDSAIRSVVNQPYPGKLELLIVDDGSPRPIEECMRFSHISHPDCLRIIRSQRNHGLVHALNVGLRAAKHKLIGRIDADDIWMPGKIERQVKRFTAEPDLSIVGTGMTVVFGDARESEIHIRRDGWSEILRFFVEVGCPFPHGSIIARKDIYQLLGGYPHSPDAAHCEDYALWSVWLRFFKPAMIEESLYQYSVTHSSISSIYSEQQRLASGRISEAFARLGITETLPRSMGEIGRILGISLLQAGVLCYRIWHYRLAVKLPEAAIELLRIILPDRQVFFGAHTLTRTPLSVPELLVGFDSTLNGMSIEHCALATIY